MAAPNVLPGEGTSLKIKIAAAFTEVAQVHEIDGPDITVKAVPNASLKSTVMSTRPSKLPTPGKTTIKIWFDPNDVTVQNIFTSRVSTPGTVDDFEITFNDGNVTTQAMGAFSGFVTGFKLNGLKNEENVGADVELQLTTIVTWTPGTA